MIDFQNYAGARIDRKLNKENGLREVSPFWANLPNMTIYMPSNPFKMTARFLDPGSKKGPIKMDTLTLELKVAIRSNLKLDLVDLKPDAGQNPNFLSPKRKNDDEIHFVQFEGRMPAIELSMEAMKQN